MRERLYWSHLRRAGAITTIRVHCAHCATGRRDGWYRQVGRTDAWRRARLGTEDESSCINLHLVGRDHETEIVEKKEV